MEIKKYSSEEIKLELESYLNNTEYNIVYINYEKEFGIKIVKEGKSFFGENENKKLKKEDFNDFYKIYIFNKDEMKTVYKFSNDDYRISEIKYEYDDEKKTKILNYEILKEREIYSEIYLDKAEQNEEIKKKEFKIKVQVIKEKSIDEDKENNFEIVKFMKFLDC